MRRVLVMMMAALAVFTTLSGAGVTAAHTDGPVSAKDDPNGAALDTLLSWIPARTRYTCYERQVSRLTLPEASKALAAVDCENPVDGVTSVLYMLYPSTAKSTHAYATNLPASVPENENAADDACNVRFVWQFGKKEAGNAACYVATDDNTAVMLWTGDAAHILAFANGPDVAAVRQWWNGQSGPTSTAAKITDFGANTPKTSKAASKALLANVGSDVKGCKSTIGLVAPGDFDWAYYVWISAAEQCGGPQDGDIILVKINPKSAASFYDYYTRLYVVGDQTSSTPDGCAEQDLDDTNNKPVGKISCVMVGKDLYANWYNSDTGVVGSVQLNVSPTDLYTYLGDNKLL